MDTDTYRTSLTERDSVAILLKLYNADRRLNLSELSGEVFNYYSLRKRVAQFEEDGLVVVSLEMAPRKNVFVGLSPKGRKVGALLDGVRKLLTPMDMAECSLSLKYGVPVTVLLFRNGTMKLSDFLKLYKWNNSLAKTLFPAMERDGIIHQWLTQESYRTNMIELTDLGKEIGSLLDEVVRIIRKK